MKVSRLFEDISPNFRPSKGDSEVAVRLIRHEATPRAIRIFSNECHRLSDYGYWFFLSTLWVSYSGWSDLALWKRLFSSDRPGRETGLMKPSEVTFWRQLPEQFHAYRAHRPGEADWISYALDPHKATEFALRRGVSEISEYLINKGDALGLFLRRGETEVIVLDKSRVTFVRRITVLFQKEDANAVPAIHINRQARLQEAADATDGGGDRRDGPRAGEEVHRQDAGAVDDVATAEATGST